MKGHFYRRGCKYKKKKCICGSKWAFIVDIGLDPVTGKRKQKVKSGFNTKQEAEDAAAALIHEAKGHFWKKQVKYLVSLQMSGLKSTVIQKM